MKKRMSAVALPVVVAMSLSAFTSGGTTETIAAAAKTEKTGTETAKDEESGVKSTGETKEASAGTSDKKYTVILKTQTTDSWAKMWEGVKAKTAAESAKMDLYSV